MVSETRKIKQLLSSLPLWRWVRRRSLWRAFHFNLALLSALIAGALTGLIVVDRLNSSPAAARAATLETYRPSQVTLVYADDGETVIGELALERRIPLTYTEIPPVLRHAILAIEDVRYYSHIGVDPIRILGAVYTNLRTGSREGGSTLTQQLAKNLFLSNEQTIERKLREWALAIQLERLYTKEKIFEMYANYIFLGANSYGVEAAANTYFGKSVKDLQLEEAALLAALPKAPSRFSPTVNPREAKARRDLVLEQMALNGFVSRGEAEAAKAKPIKLVYTAHYPPGYKSTPFDYPVEEIRQYLERTYTTPVAQGGLRVYTTINAAAQEHAAKAIRTGLRNYDRSFNRWRSHYTNILENSDAEDSKKRTLNSYQHPHWHVKKYHPGRFVMGLIMSINETKNSAEIRFGSHTATVTRNNMGRSGKQPRTEFKIGDLVEFEIKKVDHTARRLEVTLSQIPEVQGALVTLNAKTGEIIAMVGGYDFTTNKFNNAVQAYRQTGSAFKPFIYTAAVEAGLTPDSMVSGAPIVKFDGYTRWQPRNYDGSVGSRDVALRTALARSMNVPSVHLLDQIGITTGARMVRRFGITVPMSPYLPSALGATEVPLLEMTSAYSVFPNKGERAAPYMIRKVLTHDGKVLEEREKTTSRVTNEYVALTMNEMMQDVVNRGTAARARVLGVPLGGKTGTVNSYTDAWFLGYTPTYVTGVWVGYPSRKKTLGRGMTGSRVALPIFIDFMKEFLKGKPKEDFPKPPARPADFQNLIAARESHFEDSALPEQGEFGEALEYNSSDLEANEETDRSPEQQRVLPMPGPKELQSVPAPKIDPVLRSVEPTPEEPSSRDSDRPRHVSPPEPG